jgi:hypothetical protein
MSWTYVLMRGVRQELECATLGTSGSMVGGESAMMIVQRHQPLRDWNPRGSKHRVGPVSGIQAATQTSDQSIRNALMRTGQASCGASNSARAYLPHGLFTFFLKVYRVKTTCAQQSAKGRSAPN